MADGRGSYLVNDGHRESVTGKLGRPSTLPASRDGRRLLPAVPQVSA